MPSRSLHTLVLLLLGFTTLCVAQPVAQPLWRLPECSRFRVRTERSDSLYSTPGFVTFWGSKAHLTRKRDEAFIFTNGDFPAGDGLILGSSARSWTRGYGPLQTYPQETAESDVNHRWQVRTSNWDLVDEKINFANNRARFCYNKNQALFVRYSRDEEKQPQFNCQRVMFRVECVDEEDPPSLDGNHNYENIHDL